MASKLQCTYIFTGNVGVKQHYYHCLTCNINTNPQSGICEVCAKFCHSSHNLKYIGVGNNIVCECGNKGPRFCGRMTPQLFEAQAQDTCSYSKTKTNATFQHFYQCKTCNLVGQYGLCELCCKACHKGHEVVYAGFSANFFCDCGSNGKSCKCLLPRNIEVEEEQCTVGKFGKMYLPQHFWHCTDCGLTGNMGMCETCARRCHKGHNTQYAGFHKQFFCDCSMHSKCFATKSEPMTKVSNTTITDIQSLEKALQKANNSSSMQPQPVSASTSGVDPDKYLCKICMELEVSSVFLDCGHMVLCAKCKKTKDWKSCPICNGTITSVRDVFI